jgi:hypothetical protein
MVAVTHGAAGGALHHHRALRAIVKLALHEPGRVRDQEIEDAVGAAMGTSWPLDRRLSLEQTGSRLREEARPMKERVIVMAGVLAGIVVDETAFSGSAAA